MLAKRSDARGERGTIWDRGFTVINLGEWLEARDREDFWDVQKQAACLEVGCVW